MMETFLPPNNDQKSYCEPVTISISCSAATGDCPMLPMMYSIYRLSIFTGPDSSSGRASASGSGGRRFDPRPRHTKGVKNGTKKRVVPGRYKKTGKYLLRIFVMSHNSS